MDMDTVNAVTVRIYIDTNTCHGQCLDNVQIGLSILIIT